MTLYNHPHSSRPSRPFQNRSSSQASGRKWWKLIIWGGVVAGGWFLWDFFSYQHSLKTPLSSEINEQLFTISSGESPKDIAQHLEEKEVIHSHKYFLRYIKATQLDTQLLAGSYTVSPHYTLPELATLLTTPPQLLSITIPEGLTLEEMDTLLTQKKLFEKNEFLDCIQQKCDFSSFDFLPASRNHWEGYFFPATYTFSKNTLSPFALGEQMLLAFEQRTSKHKLLENKRSLDEILIMASLIEKESSSHQGNESRMIAGILWNRIDQGIPLGVDASTRYALQKSSDPLTQTDLSHSGPFNTRKHQGLPPYGISAPGDASIHAAANPADTKYLFYLHDPSGQIRYAMTNAQHEANKQKYCGGSCE